MTSPEVAIPDAVVSDIRTVVYGPDEGTQEAVDDAVKRLRGMVTLGQVIDDQGIALLHRALQMLVSDYALSTPENWDGYSALVQDIDEYMAKCPERWAGLSRD